MPQTQSFKKKNKSTQFEEESNTTAQPARTQSDSHEQRSQSVEEKSQENQNTSDHNEKTDNTQQQNADNNTENIPVETVNAAQLKKDDLILDIRSDLQHALMYLKQPHWHVAGQNVHPAEFIKDYALDGKKKLYIMCTSGMKSAEKAREFIKAGFKNVASVDGGIMGAKYAGLPIYEPEVDDIQRQVPLVAGICILIGLVGGFMISNWFYLLPLFTGIGLVTWGLTGECTIEKVLTYMPWNKADDKTGNKESDNTKEEKSDKPTAPSNNNR